MYSLLSLAEAVILCGQGKEIHLDNFYIHL